MKLNNNFFAYTNNLNFHKNNKSPEKPVIQNPILSNNQFELPGYNVSFKMAHVPREAFDFVKIVQTTEDSEGCYPIHKSYSDETKEIHRLLKDRPEVLAHIHLKSDKSGNTPMHIADFDKMKEIHLALKGQPKVLGQIHLKQNNDKQTPMHGASLERIQEIHDALKDQPEVLAKIHLTENRKKQTPYEASSRKNSQAFILEQIIELASNSDLSVKSSIELLERYKEHEKNLNTLIDYLNRLPEQND